MGLLVGGIFDLESLAEDCAAEGVHEFLFTAPPLKAPAPWGDRFTRSR